MIMNPGSPTINNGRLLKKNHCHHTSTLANVIFPCSNSNNAFLISSSTKRTIAGAVINRYCATPISSSSSSNNHQNQSINHNNNNNNNQTKTSLSTYKFDNTRNNHGSGKNAINNGDTVAPIGPSLSSSSTTSTNSNHQMDCSTKHEKLSSIAEKNSECPKQNKSANELQLKQKNNGIDDDDNGNGNLAENNGCNDNK